MKNEFFVNELGELLNDLPNIRIIHGHAEMVNDYLEQSGFIKGIFYK